MSQVKKTYTVWVGGAEVNDHYLTEDQANNLAREYTDEGYDDVIVEDTSKERSNDR